MQRHILLLLIAAAVALLPATAANRAYRVYQPCSLFSSDEPGKERLTAMEPGDTVFATEETHAYILEKESETGVSYLPVEYGGRRGFVDVSNVYPVRLAPTDTLHLLHEHSPARRGATERFLTPAMEWAINVPVSHTAWMGLMLAGLGAAVVCMLVWGRYRTRLWLMAAAVLVAAASGAEIMYILSFKNTIWFLKPSVVGGWGKTILYFLIMSAAMAVQFVVFLETWAQCFGGKGLTVRYRRGKADDEDDRDEFRWYDKLALVPVGVGLALMVLLWADYFMDNTLSRDAYLIALAALPLAAVCGMGVHLRRMRIAEAIVMPLCFIVSGLGIALSIMHLSMLVVLVAVFGVIIGGAIIAGLGAIGGILFGGERVTGYTPDGRKISGTKDRFGNVRGDDGDTYKIIK